MNDYIKSIRNLEEKQAVLAEAVDALYANLAEKQYALQEAKDRYAQALANLALAEADYDRLKPRPSITVSDSFSENDVADEQEAFLDSLSDSSVFINDFLVNNSRVVRFGKDTLFTQFLSDTVNLIKACPFGNLTIDNPTWYSFNKATLSALKKRANLSLTINFRYKGKKYSFIIPEDYNLDLLQDSNGWYGFMYLMSVFGGHEII